MPRFISRLLLSFIVLCTVPLGPVHGQDAPASAPPAPAPLMMPPSGSAPSGPEPAPVMEKVSPGVFRVGNVMMYKNERSVSFPAQINMDRGLLEYLLVRRGGKTHESLFRTDIHPMELQVALLLLGLEGTDRPLAYQGAPETPRGNPVEISVVYQIDNRVATLRPEDWLVRKDGEVLMKCDGLSWVFTGSMVRGGRFLAGQDGSMIALYHDPVALVDNASPGGESDRIWFVNEKTVPPVGTPVTIRIKAVK